MPLYSLAFVQRRNLDDPIRRDKLEGNAPAEVKADRSITSGRGLAPQLSGQIWGGHCNLRSAAEKSTNSKG